jgi:hypothetical protein
MEAKTRSMYECIFIKVQATYDSKDKIKMLAICPLAMFAQGLCCHVFKVLIGTVWKKTYHR